MAGETSRSRAELQRVLAKLMLLEDRVRRYERFEGA
jgi:hypothetical protein